MESQRIFENLWNIYTDQNPSVQKIHDLFTSNGEEVVNDHIAFRTFDDQRINIDVLARPFLKSGYVEKGSYVFEAKKLVAKHYEIEGDPKAPRVFISQLLTGEFSDYLQDTVNELIGRIPEDQLQSDDLIFSGKQWGTVSFETYKKLIEESEYAAWLYAFGFCANHFTVSVNFLKKFNTLQKVNQLLKDNGFLMNDSGGEIKGTPEQLLEQSSIKAGLVELDFTEGTKSIPGCYYEFAKRYNDKDGSLFSGFIAKSADKIFESTDYYEEK